MATLPRVPTGNNKQYTLDAQAGAGATTMTLNESIASVVRGPGYCVVDRIDSAGNLTASKREYKHFTGVSGSQLTGVTSVDGTDQVHPVGAIVEFVPDVKYEQDWYDVFTQEHSTGGAHSSLPSIALLNTLRIAVASNASAQMINTVNFFSSNATITGVINASGASIVGFIPLRPVFRFPTASSASAGIGSPMDMPQAGNIQFVSVTLNSPISGASLILDINKNFTSIFDAGTRPTILGGGTFVSTASIATKLFNLSDKFSVDQDTSSNLVNASVLINAR